MRAPPGPTAARARSRGRSRTTWRSRRASRSSALTDRRARLTGQSPERRKERAVGAYTGRGIPDPEVGRRAFEAALGRKPAREEMVRLMARRPRHLPEEVSSSPGYVVLDGGRAGARSLIDSGCLLGLTTGNVGRGSTRFFSFGGYGSHSADRTELTCTALERAACVSAGISHPTPAWPVGDTARDVEAGPGAGIRVVGVASGEYGVSELRETGADFTLASMSERLPVL